jgi:hydrogenase/urease accessory protein HupE
MTPSRCLSRIFLVLLTLCSSAEAHMSFEGGDEIWSGMAHPALTPSHVILIICLALFLGQRLPFNNRMPMLVLSLTSAASLSFTLLNIVPEPGAAVLLAVALVIASLVALERRGPPWVCGILCAAAAIAIGLDSGVEAGSRLLNVKVLAGTWISLNLLVAYLSFIASQAGRHPLAKTGVRVLAAWIIAIALLMLAFSLRR